VKWSPEAVVAAVRSEGLVVERLDAETLIYDLERDQAHHLNAAAATVFELCDGRATLAEVAAEASRRLERPVTPDTVAEALDQLAGSGLLDGVPEAGLPRRELVRKAAVAGAGAAFAAPLVKSIVAPTPAQAQSPACAGIGEPCTTTAPNCCEGLICNPPKGPAGTCQQPS
jgi:hypothetical protein